MLTAAFAFPHRLQQNIVKSDPTLSAKVLSTDLQPASV